MGIHRGGSFQFLNKYGIPYVTLKAPTLILFIGLSLISSTHFGALPHHYQGLRISCRETKTLKKVSKNINAVREIRTDEVQR